MQEHFARLRAKAQRLARDKYDGTPESIASVAEAVEGYSELHMGLLDEQLTMLVQARRHPPLACKKGCAHCCHTQVAATVPEIARLARDIRATFSDEEVQSLLERLRAHRKRILALNGNPRPPAPCPLLDDENACTVHPSRPLTCRTFNSVDVGVCASARENWQEPAQVPSVAQYVYTMSSLHFGLSDGLKGAGLRDEMVEMPMALLTMLEQPESLAQWLSGDDAFAEARAHGGPQHGSEENAEPVA